MHVSRTNHTQVATTRNIATKFSETMLTQMNESQPISLMNASRTQSHTSGNDTQYVKIVQDCVDTHEWVTICHPHECTTNSIFYLWDCVDTFEWVMICNSYECGTTSIIYRWQQHATWLNSSRLCWRIRMSYNLTRTWIRHELNHSQVATTRNMAKFFETVLTHMNESRSVTHVNPSRTQPHTGGNNTQHG